MDDAGLRPKMKWSVTVRQWRTDPEIEVDLAQDVETVVATTRREAVAAASRLLEKHARLVTATRELEVSMARVRRSRLNGSQR